MDTPRKKRNSLSPLGTLQLRSDFTQKVPPQYDITRSKERTGREREMHGHEILKQNQDSWQTEEKISKLSVNILGLIIGISANQSYSLEFSGTILFTTA